MARRKDTRGSDRLSFPDHAELGDQESRPSTKVECLGMTFDSEEDRRGYFLTRLQEKLRDPEFRNTPGFPKGSDEAILRMSDPPWYTACPNPFLEDYVRCYGKPYEPGEPYHREPFAVDVSVGRADALYKVHAYHTKVPHLAIVPSILHYTKPGDIILDGFCGSGMTGVAAQWCGAVPADYRKKTEAEWFSEGKGKPPWGARRAILGDLSPAASFIAANLNLAFDLRDFLSAAARIIDEVESELGWMFETQHTDSGSTGQVNFTVWSQVFACPNCGNEIVFTEEGLDPSTKKLRKSFPCSQCMSELTKRSLQRAFETRIDPATGDPWQVIRLRPVIVNYSVSRKRFEKTPDERDLELIHRAESLPLPQEVPVAKFPIERMYHGSRLAPKGFTHVHQMYFARTAHVLAALWRRAESEDRVGIRNGLKFLLDSHFINLSIQNRYRPEVSFPYNPLTGV